MAKRHRETDDTPELHAPDIFDVPLVPFVRPQMRVLVAPERAADLEDARKHEGYVLDVPAPEAALAPRGELAGVQVIHHVEPVMLPRDDDELVPLLHAGLVPVELAREPLDHGHRRVSLVLDLPHVHRPPVHPTDDVDVILVDDGTHDHAAIDPAGAGDERHHRPALGTRRHAGGGGHDGQRGDDREQSTARGVQRPVAVAAHRRSRVR